MGCNQSTEQKPATTAGQQPQALPDTSNAKESINTAGESTADTPAAPYEPNNVIIGANDDVPNTVFEVHELNVTYL
jgi:hypothetical protein